VLINQFVKFNDRKAFTILIERHLREIRSLLFTLLNGNPEDIEDVEQEIFISLYEKLSSFRFKSSFKTYFYRLSRNKAIDFLRKRTREKKYLFHMYSEPVKIFTDPQDDLINMEEKNRIFNILFKLDRDERSLILLKDIEGLSIRDISKIFRIPDGTVKSRLHRSREKLVKMLEGEKHEKRL